MNSDASNNRIPRPLNAAVDLAALLGGLVVLVLAFLVFADVIGRWMGSPIHGARDFMTMMLVVIVASGIALGWVQGVHISMDFVERLLPPRALRVLNATADTLSIVLLGILAWQCFRAGLEAADFGEVTMLISLPFGPFYQCLAAGFALTALVAAAQLIGKLNKGASK